jgi:hypothetical protein
VLAGGRHRRFFCRGKAARSHVSSFGLRRFGTTWHELSPVPGQKLQIGDQAAPHRDPIEPRCPLGSVRGQGVNGGTVGIEY